MCKTIKQKTKFKAPPEFIYSLLTESKKYEALTGKKAKIGKRAGTFFSVYGGRTTGILVELVKNKRIVQAWRGHRFPDGIFSMATFNFKSTKDGGTEVILIHRGVPKELIPSIEHGWRKYNWEPIKRYISNLNY